jgi:hypothetical protein
MAFPTPARLFDKVARWAGYVPRSEADEAVSKITAEKHQLAGELRHKNSNLRSQIMLRDRLENELQFLRDLELAHAKKESGVQQAVDRMDAITGTLLEYMKTVWPDTPDLGQATEETRETAAV